MMKKVLSLLCYALVSASHISLAQSLVKPLSQSSESWLESQALPHGSWTYGTYTSGDDYESFTPLTTFGSYYGGVDSWIGEQGEIWSYGGPYPRISKFAMSPAPTLKSIKRWVSDIEGTVRLSIDCQQLQDSLNDQVFELRKNGELLDLTGKSDGQHHVVIALEVDVVVGDILDFAIDAKNNHNADWTHLDITVSAPNPLLDSALFYFPMDESALLPLGRSGIKYNRRERIADYSGNHNHAAMDFSLQTKSPKMVQGVVGRSKEFHRGRAFSKLEKSDVGDGLTELTLSIWICPDEKVVPRTDNSAAISSTGADYFSLLLSSYGEGNPIEFRAKGNRLTGPDFSAPALRWTHVVGVWKSGEEQVLYVDGVEVARATNPPTGAVDVDQWMIGRDRLVANRHFHGRIDEVLLLENALSAEDVTSLYNESQPEGFEPVLGQGFVRRDLRYNVTSAVLEDYYGDKAHLDQPDEINVFDSASTGSLDGLFQSSTFRGYITAPEAGEYQFWLSARNSAEFYLSSDVSKYRKRKIAELSPIVGTGVGIPFSSDNLWDVYESQISKPVFLQEGERYYFEVVQVGSGSDTHISLAWAPPGGERVPVPSDVLSFYHNEEGDDDDDSLPDAWEVENGLDPLDNGFGDFAGQGERGDFDGDGLKNREEFLAGTDPNNWDTDGDQVSDLDELRSLNSDPLIQDQPGYLVVDSLDFASFASPDSQWSLLSSGEIVPNTSRPSLSWQFDVPEGGFWLIEGLIRMAGNVDFIDSDVEIQISIDGKPFQNVRANLTSKVPQRVRLVSPYLSQGTHEVNIFFNNYIGRRKPVVSSLSLIEVDSEDSDGDGVPDWVSQQFDGRSQLFDHVRFSHISPAFVEGRSPSVEFVDLTAITRSGEVDRKQRYNSQQWDSMLPGFQTRLDSYETNLQAQMRQVQLHPEWYQNDDGRMEGYQLLHQEGTGEDKWFAQVPLVRNEAIGYVAQFENLGIVDNRILVWAPYNVLDGGSLDIPVGSELLLGAWVQDWDWQTVTLTIDGQDYSFPSAETHVQHFTQAGTYDIVASHPGGQSETLTVTVHAATFTQETYEVVENGIRSFDFPEITAGSVLDTGDLVSLIETVELSTGGISARLSSQTPGRHKIAARLGQAGPILDLADVSVTGLSDAWRNGSSVRVSPEDPNLKLITSELFITDLPAGGHINIVIFRAGITFRDGTTVLQLTAEDFVNGVYQLEFLMPRGLHGGYCHYIEVVDASGTIIARD